MKKIFFKIIILFLAVITFSIPIAIKFDKGTVDPFYTRFTTEKAQSLVIGTSRAAQGINPNAFYQIAPQMQNFAFTLAHSPFGPAYLELIKDKLDLNSKDGLFIIAIDPWSVSNLNKGETSAETFRENSTFISKIHCVNLNPNFEYIYRFFDKSLYKVFVDNRTMKLHKNGWLEVDIPVDSGAVKLRTKEKIIDYEKYAVVGNLSNIRLKELQKTITFLNKYGDVFLVRLPVSKEIAKIEKLYAPDFDKRISEIANQSKSNYLNYFDESGNYLTTDGNHLYKSAAHQISNKILIDIKNITKKSFKDLYSAL